jgi:type VI secretion system protein ImpL
MLLPGASAPLPKRFGKPLAAALASVLLAGAAALILSREADAPPPAATQAPMTTGAEQAPSPAPVEAAESPAPVPRRWRPTSPAPMPPGSFDFPGPPADTYTKIVQPACRAATQDLFPFFGSGTGDAPAAEVRRLFGPGGMLPAFFDQRLKPMVATDGPVWRWKPGAPAAFDPATPELLARLPALTALIGNGLDIAIEAVDFGGGVTGAALALPGAELRFDRIGAAATARWTLSDKPADSSLALFKAGARCGATRRGAPGRCSA